MKPLEIKPVRDNLLSFRIASAESRMQYAITAIEYRRRALEAKLRAEKVRRKDLLWQKA